MKPSETEKKNLREAYHRKVAEMWIRSIRDEFTMYGDVDEAGLDFYADRLKEILCIDEDPKIRVNKDIVEIVTNDMVIRYEAGVIRATTREMMS
jgi:hypothetical protein